MISLNSGATPCSAAKDLKFLSESFTWDVFRRILDIVLGGEGQQVSRSNVFMLATDGEFVPFLRNYRRFQNETQIVCGRNMPRAILFHDEREVLGVVIRVVGEDIEHHPQVEFVQFFLWNGKLPAG